MDLSNLVYVPQHSGRFLIHFGGNEKHNSSTEEKIKDAVKINGVPLRGTLIMMIQKRPDQRYSLVEAEPLQDEKNGYRLPRDALWVWRPDRFFTRDDGVSPKTRQKLFDALVQAGKAWAKENEKAFEDADRAERQERLEKCERLLDQAEEFIEKLQAAKARLSDKRDTGERGDLVDVPSAKDWIDD